MSYSVDNIIRVNTRIVPQGLGNANFAKAMLFAPEDELPAGFDTDTYKVYFNITELSADFDSTTETYQAASAWLTGIPATRELVVYARADGASNENADANWTDTLNKAYDKIWWFWTFVTESVYATEADVLEIAGWCNGIESMFVNNQTGAAATAIRNPNTTTDICTQLTTLGYRTTFTMSNADFAYPGNALAKFFAAVNYSAANSTITGNGKKLSGVPAEDLTGTEYTAMDSQSKKCVYYSVVDLQGQIDVGRTLNTYTHSSYGEYIDDVVNLAAFVNALKVNVYNTIENTPTKVGQDPIGQALVIGAARQVCEQYIQNGYLGPRVYTDPDDAIEKFTNGYVILTKAEDILTISDSDRAARKSAPLRIRIFRKGAIHTVDIDVDVY